MQMEGHELQEELLGEYSRTVDSSTILAILSDYNLSNPEDLSTARIILDILRASVPEEEAFLDPNTVEDHDESTSARSRLGWSRSEEGTTDNTSPSQNGSTLEDRLGKLDFVSESSSSLGRNDDIAESLELDCLNDEQKEERLAEMFPGVKAFDVKWTLKKCKGDTGRAIEELMTQAFLEESGEKKMGVDGYNGSQHSPKPKKGKGKKKRGARRTEDLESSQDHVSPTSKWETGNADTEFISSKTSAPINQVKALYHFNGGSTSKTIAAIIDSQLGIGLDLSDLDPTIQINAYELHQEFPSIPTTHLTALLQLSHPSVSDARDLAKALVSKPAIKGSPIVIEFRHAPLNLSSNSPPSTPKMTPLASPFASPSSSTSANQLIARRNDLYTQASSAYRRGKSDHLMGGAAAYYSSEARDVAVRARAAKASEMDSLVASQSRTGELDLHGVDVKNAVRISSNAVNKWWNGLAETRARNGGVNGEVYKIVTGVGRHSVDGKAKLGPAVMRALMGEGWKVQAWSGYLEVGGRVRK